MSAARPIARFGGLLVALILCLLASVSLAETAPDMAAWQQLADKAEQATEAGDASDDVLDSMRSDLANWRDTFLASSSQNSDRIATLQAQISALGPAPNTENGEAPESQDVAERRAQLNKQLADLRAPVIAAEEAYRRADGLIREIDNLIRERRTDQLLELQPSPLNPARWTPAAEVVARTFSEIVEDTVAQWQSDERRTEMRNNLPVVVVLALLGLVLILRGRAWATHIVTWLSKRARRGTGVWRFLVSLGQIVLPLAGLILLISAFQITGMVGDRLEPFVMRMASWGTTILLIWWLGDQVFSRDDDVATVSLESFRRAEARFYSLILAVCLVVHDFVSLLSESGSLTEATRYLLDFPVVFVSGMTLFRLGQILAKVQVSAEDDEQTFTGRVIWLIGRAVMVIGIVAPLLVGIGYGAAGTALVYPAVNTLLLLGLVSVLQRLVFDVNALVTGPREGEQGGLVPVLVGFLLSICALPFLALIWGARVTDLTEVWARFREGLVIGDTQISPTDFVTFAVIFAIGYMMTRLLQAALRTSVLPKTRIDPGGQTAILSGIGYVGIAVAGLAAITTAGIDLTALGYVAGALSVGIGFGLQNIVSNFVSGIILLIERPIAKGDWIEVGGQMGYVRDISVRSTRIETFDRTDVIVPNSDFISGTVTNYTRGNTIGRVIVPVGVAYGTDTRKVEKILQEIAGAHPMVLANPAPNVVFRAFGADSLNFEIRAILRDVNWVLAVQSEMNHEIARRFGEEGIEIPFAQRDIWLRNPEALRAPPVAPPPAAVAEDEGPRTKGAPDAPPEKDAEGEADDD
ncbi:DUF3772 domain-containing protein [Albibacillus kandeliae]|uniref:DUF3772 domain-containing protein n=1 Tax=Albibacillus kandeliae TaxID=2174228 RepID=UPI000DD434BE|nr:DUF3772 domain-containing protein [Albibacillus kandeliae]